MRYCLLMRLDHVSVYAINYSDSISAIMSSLLSSRVKVAPGAWAAAISSSTAFTLRESAKNVSPEGLTSYGSTWNDTVDITSKVFVSGRKSRYIIRNYKKIA